MNPTSAAHRGAAILARFAAATTSAGLRLLVLATVDPLLDTPDSLRGLPHHDH